MSDPTNAGPGSSPAYLTTKEVAELLRVKERKVYDLAAMDDIPHRRMTGKLLFPHDEIMAWLRGDAKSDGEIAMIRPPIVVGSHDPLLDWAVRESGCGLATLFDGSEDGLRRFAHAEAAMSGIHIAVDGGWNLESVRKLNPLNSVLIGWAKRARGLLVSPDKLKKISQISDLEGKRFARRQEGSGTRILFDRLAYEADLRTAKVEFLLEAARTETDAASAVASGDADATLGLEAAARSFGLGFVPLIDENFDLLIDRRAYFTTPMQTLLEFTRSDGFFEKARSMTGYDLTSLGQVRWVSD